MARITRRIHSRGYELDARLRVPPGVIARYCEHVRWASLIDADGVLTPLLTEGRKVVVRAQDIAFNAPLMQNEELELSLEVAHVGRSSFKLVQRVTRVADGANVARAIVTCVLVDAHMRPTPVPSEVAAQAADVQEDVSSPPLLERPASGVWTCAWQVRPSDLDALQHMNQSRYVELFDDVRELCARAGGYGASSERARAYPARVVVDYKRETRLGAGLSVLTWASAEGALGFELLDALDGHLVAKGRIDLPT